PLVDDRDQRQNDEADYGNEDARLKQRGAIRRGAAFQEAAETRSDAGEDERARDDPDEGANDEGGEAHAEERRRQVDEPERKQRHQAQHEHVAELVLAEARLQLLQERAGAGAQEIPEDGLGEDENDRGAERRGDQVADPAPPGPEQEPAERRQEK